MFSVHFNVSFCLTFCVFVFRLKKSDLGYSVIDASYLVAYYLFYEDFKDSVVLKA